MRGTKRFYNYLDGTTQFEDTRTIDEAHQENLTRIRELITAKILEAGYDEIWQRNAAMGVIDEEQVEAGRAFIANLRTAYHDYKARLLASTRDEADAVPLVAPPVPEGLWTLLLLSKLTTPKSAVSFCGRICGISMVCSATAAAIMNICGSLQS